VSVLSLRRPRGIGGGAFDLGLTPEAGPLPSTTVASSPTVQTALRMPVAVLSPQSSLAPSGMRLASSAVNTAQQASQGLLMTPTSNAGPPDFSDRIGGSVVADSGITPGGGGGGGGGSDAGYAGPTDGEVAYTDTGEAVVVVADPTFWEQPFGHSWAKVGLVAALVGGTALGVSWFVRR